MSGAVYELRCWLRQSAADATATALGAVGDFDLDDCFAAGARVLAPALERLGA